MIHLVIGLGEVGKAIQKVLECAGYDISFDPQTPPRADILHICFPYSDKFKSQVIHYKQITGANLIIVHSTVPIGTCDPEGWVHSPVRGVHPHLEKGVRTFVKYFGGQDAFFASSFFHSKGIRTQVVSRASDVEALKLWSTTQYGIFIMLEKEIHEFCKKNNLDFDLIYKNGNTTYNEGYKELGRLDVIRPILEHHDGPIGGHCVIPNAHLLDSPSANRLLEDNSSLLD